MLDPAYVRDHLDEVRTGLRNRGLDPEAVITPFAALDASRRAQIVEVENLKREQNAAGEEVARAKSSAHAFCCRFSPSISGMSRRRAVSSVAISSRVLSGSSPRLRSPVRTSSI